MPSSSLFKKNFPLGSTLLFTTLGFLRPALSIFLLPIYLKYLEPSDYGVLALITIFSSSLALMGNLRLDSAFQTKYFDYYDDAELLYTYLKNISTAIIILALLLLIFFGFTGPLLFEFIFKEQTINYYPYGFIACIGALSSMCMSPYFIYLRNKLQLKSFALLTLINVLSTIIMQVVLVVYLEANILGIIVGGAVPNFLLLIYLIVKQRLIVWNFTFKNDMIKSSLRFSIPLLPYVLLDVLITKGDRYFIANFLDLSQVGLYALLISVISLIDIVFSALDNSIRPLLFDLFKRGIKENSELIKYYFSFYAVIAILNLYGLFYLGNHIELITNKESYISIKEYFGLACVSMVPLIFVRIFNLQLMYFGKSGEISWLTFYKAILIVFLFVFLIPSMGLWGVLLSILVSNSFSGLIFWYKSRRLIGSVYDLKLFIIITSFFIFSIVIFDLFEFDHSSLLMIIPMLLLITMSLIAYQFASKKLALQGSKL